jgi:hypothetical protein
LNRTPTTNCQMKKGRYCYPPFSQHIIDPNPVGQLLLGQQYPITPFNSNPHWPQTATVGLMPGKRLGGTGAGRTGMTGTPMRRAFSSGVSGCSRIPQGHRGSPFWRPTHAQAGISPATPREACNPDPSGWGTGWVSCYTAPAMDELSRCHAFADRACHHTTRP